MWGSITGLTLYHINVIYRQTRTRRPARSRSSASGTTGSWGTCPALTCARATCCPSTWARARRRARGCTATCSSCTSSPASLASTSPGSLTRESLSFYYLLRNATKSFTRRANTTSVSRLTTG